ncbi:MAG: GWxTD domain-containing protein [Bacteroidia bacterium]|nr:GWxTD domain-containing protein [Bacteroidia bacterium]
MKRLLVALMILATGHAGYGKEVMALLTYATFNSPANGPYIETYLTVLGNTVEQIRVKNTSMFRGDVEVNLLFRQGDSIRAYRKYVLAGPETADTNKCPNFVDVQRIPLKEGIYKLEFTISDKNKKKGRSFSAEVDVTVSFRTDKVVISDVEFVDSYKKAEMDGPLTKSGMDIVPYVSNFFPPNLQKMVFYAEIYNSRAILGDGEKFLVNYHIENYMTGQRLASFRKFSTMTTAGVNIVLADMNITDLPTGNYNLVIEMRNKMNEVITERKAFFQRNNPGAKLDIPDIQTVNTGGTFVEKFHNKDSLIEIIRSLRPVSDENEKQYADNQILKSDVSTMQRYLYSFWLNRSPMNPEAAFVAYQKEVALVNKVFKAGTIKGYETDRGRVYLMYGAPNDRTVSENEPSTYPYEIWHYHKLKDQVNKKFVFYNTDLATNNYTLLHSDAKGEKYDSRWQMKLKARTFHSADFDIEKPGVDLFGDKTQENFNNPK